MTRIVLATEYGGPEVLTLVERPAGDPGPGEALLEVRAAGVNPADWKAYTGAFGRDESRLPLPLGFEAAGVVAAVGEGAEGPAGPLAVGDEVIGFRLTGAYAEQVVVPAAALVPKPAALDWAPAAGLMLAGATAVHALTATDVAAGDVLLVHGAAGGVGSMLLQLAAVRGARVIGTAGEGSFELVRRFGAEPVAYGPGLVDRVRALAPEGVTAAVDAVGTDEAVDASLALVADRSRIASIAAFSRADTGIRLLGNGPGADPGTEVRDAARLELTAMVELDRLSVVVDRTFPLAEVAEAHRYGMAGHAHGKIVLLP